MKDSGDVVAMRERVIADKIWIEIYRAIGSAMPESAGAVLRAANIATDAAIDALRGPKCPTQEFSNRAGFSVRHVTIDQLLEMFPHSKRKTGKVEAVRLKVRP